MSRISRLASVGLRIERLAAGKGEQAVGQRRRPDAAPCAPVM